MTLCDADESQSRLKKFAWPAFGDDTRGGPVERVVDRPALCDGSELRLVRSWSGARLVIAEEVLKDFNSAWPWLGRRWELVGLIAALEPYEHSFYGLTERTLRDATCAHSFVFEWPKIGWLHRNAKRTCPGWSLRTRQMSPLSRLPTQPSLFRSFPASGNSTGSIG
jgi:hypothetical protein